MWSAAGEDYLTRKGSITSVQAFVPADDLVRPGTCNKSFAHSCDGTVVLSCQIAELGLPGGDPLDLPPRF